MDYLCEVTLKSLLTWVFCGYKISLTFFKRDKVSVFNQTIFTVIQGQYMFISWKMIFSVD